MTTEKNKLSAWMRGYQYAKDGTYTFIGEQPAVDFAAGYRAGITSLLKDHVGKLINNMLNFDNPEEGFCENTFGLAKEELEVIFRNPVDLDDFAKWFESFEIEGLGLSLCGLCGFYYPMNIMKDERCPGCHVDGSEQITRREC